MQEKQENHIIKKIIESEHFDTEALDRLLMSIGSTLEPPEYIEHALKMKYAVGDLNEVLSEGNAEEAVEFLNWLIRSLLEARKEKDRKKLYRITAQELEQFRSLAQSTEVLSVTKLSKTAPLLTKKTFLEMCRIVYDSTSVWKYPDDISTEYLFCDGRMLDPEHERTGGILGLEPDDAEGFALAYSASYHPEELWFGGPKLYIRDESARRAYGYTMPKKYGRWTGWIYCSEYAGIEDVYRAIKMYIALRSNGYPIYCHDYDNICKHWQTIENDKYI